MRSVARDIKQPDQSVGRLPDHRIAERVKRITRDRSRRRPTGSVLREARAEHGGAVVVVFTLPAEKHQVQIAVLQLVKAGRVLVVSRLDLRSQDALDFHLLSREQFTEKGKQCDEAKGSL